MKKENFGFKIGRFIRYLGLTAFLFVLTTNYTNAQDSLVGGTLTDDEVWTNDYTYIIYKDLRIPEGITLTILPGVTVKVNQGRGIYILGGNMIVDGQVDEIVDSINLIANHTDRSQAWKWKGISFTGNGSEMLNNFSFVKIVDAEIALDIFGSDYVIVDNCSLIDNQNIGARIFNSRNCQIIDCLFQNNYDGIEMVSSEGSETSGNLIQNCVFKNLNHNIYLLNAFGGIFLNNTIENNLIEGGNNGVWADNGGGYVFQNNSILKNIFINIGYEDGYALLIAVDSLEVKNNIFWDNRIAIFYDPFTIGSQVHNNSFYQNEESILLAAGSDTHEFENNTFALNHISVFKAFESENLHFNKSNIFYFPGKNNIIINETRNDIDFTSNFWNTTDETKIQKLIWDKKDNPELGVVNITPYLQEADTVSPVSPPSNPIKQLVNGRVKLSWSQNPESDLQGYNIYYGDFNNYSFSNSVGAVTDTVFFLTEISISDSIAITASDGTINSAEAQLMGHESPFSFASIYPYAGPNDFMCEAQVGVQIAGSTIPYEYQSLNWSTNGDGIFNNPASLNPFYTAGNADLLNGKVELTLRVVSNGKELFDSMILYIFADPEAFAGNDTIIFSDLQFDINTATAEHENSIQWISTGDGSFNNDTLIHPIYSPGPADIALGVVNLVLIAQSQCGIATDTMKLFLDPYFSIEGNLWYNNQRIQDGVILAIKENEEGARTTDITQAGSDGYFRFDKLMAGNYYVYAVPDTLLSNGAVPGYYANNLNWQDAYTFTVEANTFDVDIQLPSLAYQLPAGEGSISGYFEMPELGMFNKDIYCNSWFEPESKLEYCSGGLSNITVFLYNSDGTMLLDFTLTNENGDFFFKKLPYGSYIVDAEKAGYQTVVSSVITISPEHKHETGVVLKSDGNKIGIFRADNNQGNLLVTVYPNPAAGFLNIPVGDNNSGAVISLYNSLGQLELKIELSADNNIGLSTARVDVSELAKGFYFGKININNVHSSFIFIKN